jgi:hypothetical protein
MAKRKSPKSKKSTALVHKKRTSLPRRARKNPEAWKFAVGIPVAIGAGFLLYKYVFMNEAQAAEMIESKTPAALPGPTETTLPSSGAAAPGAEGAGAAPGAGGTTEPATTATPRPVLPASGKACYAGKIGGKDVKIQMNFAGNKTTGSISVGSKVVSKLGIVATAKGFALSSIVGDPTIAKSFSVRRPIQISDAGMSHNGWSLSKVNC